MRFPVFSVRPCAADHTRKLINMAITKPVGTKDMLPEEAAFWMAFQETAADVFGRYGYQPIVTPVLEKHELFVRGIGEATDVVSKEMFQALSDENLNILTSGGHVKSKSRLALRPEGTAGVVRAVAEYNLVAQGAAPVKLMYAGPMFRAERPQEGRQRQFNQIGIECLGADDPSVDAEGIIMLMRFYRELGIPSESIRLLVNSMGCEKCRPAYRDSVKAYIMEHADCMCEDCLRRAGLGEKLDSLPQGMDTKLDPQVHPQGIRLSGGEAQKVMMARALFKDAPVLVLDEPTSALDPIAENEIYLRYRDMTQGKTSLFISHRLASTRFCHRILFLQDGKIVEEGTHSQLMEKGGVYAKLYEIQSCWYRDDYKGGESA